MKVLMSECMLGSAPRLFTDLGRYQYMHQWFHAIYTETSAFNAGHGFFIYDEYAFQLSELGYKGQKLEEAIAFEQILTHLPDKYRFTINDTTVIKVDVAESELYVYIDGE